MISPELLRRFPYFAQISDASLKAIAMMAEEKTVPAGTRVFNEGDPANTFNIIARGQVNIQYILGNGEHRTVDTLVAGDILLWSALIEPYYAKSVGTTTEQTQLIAIDAPKLARLCDQDPQVGYRLTMQVAKLLAHRLEGARVQLATV